MKKAVVWCPKPGQTIEEDTELPWRERHSAQDAGGFHRFPVFVYVLWQRCVATASLSFAAQRLLYKTHATFISSLSLSLAMASCRWLVGRN